MTAPLSNVALGREGSGAAQILDSSAIPSMFIDFYKQKYATAQAQEAARVKREQALQDKFMSIDYKPPESKYATAGLQLRNEKLKGVVDLAMETGSWSDPRVMAGYTESVGAVDRFAAMAEEYKNAVKMVESALNDPYKSKELDAETYDNYEKLTSFPPTAEGLTEALKFAKSKPMLIRKFNPSDIIEPLIMERTVTQDGRHIVEEVDDKALEVKMDSFIAAPDGMAAINRGIDKGYWKDVEGFKTIVRASQPPKKERDLPVPVGPRPTVTEAAGNFTAYDKWFTLGDYTATPVYNPDGTIKYVPFTRQSGTTEAKKFPGPDNKWQGVFIGYKDLGEDASPRYIAEFATDEEVITGIDGKTTKRQGVTKEIPFDRSDEDVNYGRIVAYLGADPVEATEMWAVQKKPLQKPKAPAANKNKWDKYEE